jgi:threonine dehydrogenase-like Zn-dependent dehydrogenase
MKKRRKKHMRATVFHGPRDVRVERVPDTGLQEPTDVVVRITHAAICGSDLWPYRGLEPFPAEGRLGHEWMGMVEDVGSQVSTIKKGDRVIAPFAFADGTCEFCHKRLYTNCLHGGFWGQKNDGGQAEAIRAPFADATLIVIPKSVEGDEARLKAILPLSDVMGTGHYAAVLAGVHPGGTVAVIGDGAGGLCGVLAARRLGAERIILLGHQQSRLELGRRLGATDIVSSRGEQAEKEVVELTKGGAESVMECVGMKSSMDTAIAITRPGGTVGYVGVPHGVEQIDLMRLFFGTIALRGGGAPVRAFLPELLQDVIAGKLDPSPVLDMTVELDGVPAGYAAMDQRKAMKVMIRP